jgi:hypothetical protein
MTNIAHSTRIKTELNNNTGITGITDKPLMAQRSKVVKKIKVASNQARSLAAFLDGAVMDESQARPA